jgi:hypothetical protein
MKPIYLYKNPKTLLNKGTGFLSGYSHSLNPYGMFVRLFLLLCTANAGLNFPGRGMGIVGRY